MEDLSLPTWDQTRACYIVSGESLFSVSWVLVTVCGLSPLEVDGLLIVVALPCCRALAVGHLGSVVVA